MISAFKGLEKTLNHDYASKVNSKSANFLHSKKFNILIELNFMTNSKCALTHILMTFYITTQTTQRLLIPFQNYSNISSLWN